MDQQYIVYTYQEGATPPCHAYGPASLAEANELAGRLREPSAPLTLMVLPLEPVPAEP